MYTGAMQLGQQGGIVCCLGCQVSKSHLWAGLTVFARKTEEGRAFLTVSAPSSCSAAVCPLPLPALPHCLWVSTASHCRCFPCYQHPAAPAFCCAETLQGFSTRLGRLGFVPCDQAAARFSATPACRWPSLDSSGLARILI